MLRLIAFIAGLLVFLGWIRLVGNPHVVETIIGLVLWVGVGIWVYVSLKKAFRSRGARPGDPSK